MATRKAVRKFDEIIPAVVAYMTANLVAIATPDDGRGGKFKAAWARADRLFAALDDEQQAHVDIIARGYICLVERAVAREDRRLGIPAAARRPTLRAVS